MTLQQLHYFKAVARTGSFTKAAAALYVTQPNITHAIRELEGDLGVSLFLRRGRAACLTKAGEAYLPYVDQALAALSAGQEEMERQAQGVGGTVTISYFSSLHEYLPYITSQYLHQNPSSKMEFQMTQAAALQVEQDLAEGKSMLGFGTRPGAEGLGAFELGEHPLVIIAPRDWGLGRGEAVSVKALDGKPFVAYSKNCTIRSDTDSFLAAYGVRPSIVTEVRFDNLIIGMVANSLGCAIIPVPSGTLSRRIDVVPIAEPQPPRTICLLWNEGIPLSPAGERFRDYVRENPLKPLDFIKEIQ